MKIMVSGFRRIKKAELTTGKVTLLAGKNEAGKTSLIQGIAAALSPLTIPVDLLNKQKILSIVHTGMPKSTILVEGNKWMSGISYPSCDRASEGDAVSISEYATGLKSVIDEPVKTRSEIICKLLDAYPTKEMLAEELGFNVDRLWETIQVSGWDGAHAHAKETGARLKGGWEEITGKRFGVKIAESWKPDKYEFDLADATEEELAAELKAEHEWLEISIANETITAQDVAELESAKTRLPELKNKRTQLLSDIDKLKNAFRLGKTAIANMPPALQPETQQCPNCNVPLSITGGKIVLPVQITAETIAKRKADIEEMEKSQQIIVESAAKLDKELLEINAEIVAAEKVIATKSETIKQELHGKKQKASVEECRKLVEAARTRLDAFVTYQKATKAFNNIVLNQRIVDILSPQGLRLTVVKSAIEKLNIKIKKLCILAGWKEVCIGTDMEITQEGWPHYLLSESAKYRTRVILQLVFSGIMKEGIVLIDGADILDKKGRNGLFKALSKMPFESIVGMTMHKKEDIPDLSGIGGRCYWVEDGVVA